MIVALSLALSISSVLLQLSFSDILLKDEFMNYEEYWDVDVNGDTGHVARVLNSSGNLDYMSTNVTNCRESSTPCYRAELKISQAKRGLFFPSNSVELWFGFSIRIPGSWKWDGTSRDITSYIMQVHGGDNLGTGPVIGIRNKGTVMEASICGNTAYSSATSTCSYYKLGKVVTGVWENWVVHDVFSYEEDGPGRVEVWRNGVSVLTVSGLLTSYNDANPHYLKIGTYVLQWKSQTLARAYPTHLTQWVGVEYQYVIIADENSTFKDVYSLAGTSLPSPAGNDSKGLWPASFSATHRYLLYAGIVGVGLLACSVLVVCSQKRTKGQAQGQASHTSSKIIETGVELKHMADTNPKSSDQIDSSQYRSVAVSDAAEI